MASIFALDMKSFRPVLARNLNQSTHVAVLKPYLEDGSLRCGIQGLRLGEGKRYNTLVAAMESDWSGAINEIVNAATSTAPHDSLFVGNDEDVSEQQGASEEATTLEAVGSMIRVLVANRQQTHAKAFDDVKASGHHRVLAAAFAEAVHEVQKKHAGPLHEALLGNAIQRFVPATIRELEEEVETRVQEIQSLKTENLRLKDEVRTAKSETVQAEKQLRPVKTERSRYYLQLRSAQQTIVIDKKNLEDVNIELRKTLQENRFLQHKFAEERLEGVGERKMIAELRVELEKAQKTIEEMQKKFEEAHAQQRVEEVYKRAKRTHAQDGLGGSGERDEQTHREINVAHKKAEKAQREAAEARKEAAEARMDRDKAIRMYNEMAADVNQSIGRVPRKLWDQVKPYFNGGMKEEGPKLAELKIKK